MRSANKLEKQILSNLDCPLKQNGNMQPVEEFIGANILFTVAAITLMKLHGTKETAWTKLKK
jgi:hypothetical protein